MGTVGLVANLALALVAMVGVPLAAIALVIEIFGPAYGPPATLACATTYVLTLRLKVYEAQERSILPMLKEAALTATKPLVQVVEPLGRLTGLHDPTKAPAPDPKDK